MGLEQCPAGCLQDCSIRLQISACITDPKYFSRFRLSKSSAGLPQVQEPQGLLRGILSGAPDSVDWRSFSAHGGSAGLMALHRSECTRTLLVAMPLLLVLLVTSSNARSCK